MKVILLQDVAKIGRRHQVVEVPNGHALNLLIPKGLAQPATPENVSKIKAKAKHDDAAQADKADKFAQSLALVKDKKITVSVAANDQGHLFEALKSAAVAQAFASVGAKFNETQIKIASPIKEVGPADVTLVEGDTSEVITIEVVAA